MVGPDALKWSWALFAFGLLLVADGGFNWGIFNSRRDPITNATLKYGAVGRLLRMASGTLIASGGGIGLAYLAFARLHP
jgi:hypothetical protein